MSAMRSCYVLPEAVVAQKRPLQWQVEVQVSRLSHQIKDYHLSVLFVYEDCLKYNNLAYATCLSGDEGSEKLEQQICISFGIEEYCTVARALSGD